MTPEEITQIAEVVDIAIGRRMEEVYGELENLKQQLAEAVQSVRDTAQVLHDNDVAIMGEMARVKGDPTAGVVEQVATSWRRFIEAEARGFGWKVFVPKGKE